jgi:probable F420-dependent oxidoreductase
MQLGAVLPHNEIGTDPGAIRHYLEGVEALGLTHLLVYDHVLGANPDRPGGFKGAYDHNVAFHEPMAFLSYAAAVTRSIDLVTTVLILPQRQTALVAKQVAELAVLSSNRVRLGVGIGWNEIEYEALGVPFSARGARLEEQAELLRRFWTEETFSFDGRFHKVSAAGINPRPSAHVPLWFGGSAPAALDRCARLGDGWMPLGGANDKTRELLDGIRTRRAEIGRSMDGFGVQAQAQFGGGNPDKWHGAAQKWADLGATHLAIATHNAGPTDADGHLDRLRQVRDAALG